MACEEYIYNRKYSLKSSDKMFFSSFTLMRISRGGNKLKFTSPYNAHTHLHKYLLLIKLSINSLNRFTSYSNEIYSTESCNIECFS